MDIQNLTKVFPNGRGIFDVTFSVEKGEVFGFLGPNGAGKSTTIRHLMGFMKPAKGTSAINGLDTWKDAADLQKSVGYLPGEIAFLEGMNGLAFLNVLSGMRGMKDPSRRDQLIERFQLDARTPIRKMSKGMKQKVGIVAAFMHDPDILILDEPTSGLDPLMQRIFIELILEEKQRGKTILLSSHSFQEIERTCDRAGIIKDGRLIAVEDVHDLQTMQRRVFEVTVEGQTDLQTLKHSDLNIEEEDGYRLEIAVQGDYDHFLDVLSGCNVRNLDIHTQSLEEIFMHFYDKEGENDESQTVYDDVKGKSEVH
ncbi:MAG TPA: ABC transporter ATP-binding protein [Bacillales bacterium]|nr:ABC transporter ATP-binding protein [Bacillales bacterium]